jgi:hypothetical protein
MEAVFAGLTKETFFFVPDNGTPPVVYDITGMREGLKAGTMKGAQLLRVPTELLSTHIMATRVWEQERVDALTEQDSLEPAIAVVEFVDDEPVHTVVDGTHRIVKAHQCRKEFVDVWEIPAQSALTVSSDEYKSAVAIDWGAPLSSIHPGKP